MKTMSKKELKTFVGNIIEEATAKKVFDFEGADSGYKTEPGAKPASVFLGSFQPFTAGHMAVVESMAKDGSTPFVFMVRRGKSAKPESDPFTDEQRKKWIEEAMTNMHLEPHVVELNFGMVFAIILELRDRGYELSAFYHGPDRNYAKELEKINLVQRGDEIKEETLREMFNVGDVKFDTGESTGGDRLQVEGEGVSGTRVRKSLVDDDYELFQKLTGGNYSENTYKEMKDSL